MHRTDVVVIGAGVIGASIAYHLAREGTRVTLFDHVDAPSAPSASWASAGGVRSQRRDPREWPLTVAAAARWPGLDKELEFATGFRQGGHLHVAEREDEIAELKARVERERAAGIKVEFIDAAGVRALAPALAPGVIAASYTPADGHADPRATTSAFSRAAVREGATFVRAYVERIAIENDSVIGVVVNGEMQAADLTVLAAGSWSMRLAQAIGVPLPIALRAYQMLLSMPARPVLEPTITAVNRALSLKQLRTGAFFIGGGWPGEIDEPAHACRTTPESIEGNWAVATAVVPAVGNARVATSWCGLEGDAFDGVPLIGPVPQCRGLYVAAGFTGHGFQIAPAVGEAVAQAVRQGAEPVALHGLNPAREGR
ncbi:MAG: FAD-binding oxidoreductase [Candidatus Eremiobacteraeota bacterium]|nr:FAD-binding oxidoreductase [Candidatus Eremiobacteraeota bacterium]